MEPLIAVLLTTLRLLQSLPPSTIHGRVTLGDLDSPPPNVTISCLARDRRTSQEATTDLDGRY
jgi:hypothetical protein